VRADFMSFDEYVESGSSANATIGSREADSVEGRLELGERHAFSFAEGMPATVHSTIGLFYRQSLGDDAIAGALLGQAIGFSSGIPDSEFGGFVGVGLDVALTPSASLFADSELLVGDEAQEISGMAGLRLKF